MSGTAMMRVLTLAFALALTCCAAQAQDSAASFYRGRTIQAVVGYPPGSTFELYLRLFTQHMARHVPAIRTSSYSTCRAPAP
jgi:tripartite-type tricarboxylate transporter receptor subunit TctC